MFTSTASQFSPLYYAPSFWGDATRTALGAVSSWTDLSGNGNHATQGTGGNQPVNTANQQGGKPTIVFDGTDDYLILPAALYTLPQGNNTVFAVAKAANGSLRAILNMSAAAATVLSLFNNALGDDQTGYRSDNGVTSSIITTAALSSNYNVLTAYRSGTTVSIQANNGTAATSALGANGTPDSANIGAKTATLFFLSGGIGELIIYPRALSAAEILQVNRYLSNKWSITIS